MKHYRIKLFDGANSAATKAAVCAAFQNGSESPLNLKSIAIIVQVEITENCPNTSITFVNDSLLHIDTKVNGEYKLVCIIQEVQIMEIQKETVDDMENIFN